MFNEVLLQYAMKKPKASSKEKLKNSAPKTLDMHSSDSRYSLDQAASELGSRFPPRRPRTCILQTLALHSLDQAASELDSGPESSG